MAADEKDRLKIFLCHANENEPIVKELYDRLVLAGYDPWLYSENILPGMGREDKIHQALRDADAVIVCLSSISVKKEGPIQKELKLAQDIQDEKPPDTVFLIPLLLDEVNPPPALRKIQWGDYKAPDGFEKLVRALNMRAKQIGKAIGKLPSPPVASATSENSGNLAKIQAIGVSMWKDVPADDPWFEFGDKPHIVKRMEENLAKISKLLREMGAVYTLKPSQAQKNLYYDVVGAFDALQKFIKNVHDKTTPHSVDDTAQLKTLLIQFNQKLAALDGDSSTISSLLNDDKNSPVVAPQPVEIDIAILTVLECEYTSVCNQLENLRDWPGTSKDANIYAWKTGTVFSKTHHSAYQVAVGMTGKAGNNQSALTVSDAVKNWEPRYIFFSGIAGGLMDFEKAAQDKNMIPDIHVGDVVIADIIHGYEYGKLDTDFVPRDNWTYSTDQGLLTKAIAYKPSPSWRTRIRLTPPRPCEPNILEGQVASGDKVIDNPTNAFFASVVRKWPKAKAVEMEGAGVGAAINQARDAGKVVGFMMIRGISDIPRPPDSIELFPTWDGERGTSERDNWKPYAAEVAAAFTVGMIAQGLPVPPKKK